MRRFLHETAGLTSMEYGLIISLVACILALSVHRALDSTRDVAATLNARLTRQPPAEAGATRR